VTVRAPHPLLPKVVANRDKFDPSGGVRDHFLEGWRCG
jgi:hypothetical protein